MPILAIMTVPLTLMLWYVDHRWLLSLSTVYYLLIINLLRIVNRLLIRVLLLSLKKIPTRRIYLAIINMLHIHLVTRANSLSDMIWSATIVVNKTS
jgi:hypothetical protein